MSRIQAPIIDGAENLMSLKGEIQVLSISLTYREKILTITLDSWTVIAGDKVSMFRWAVMKIVTDIRYANLSSTLILYFL